MIEEIYEMYSRKVFLFLLSKTNNVDIAEELGLSTATVSNFKLFNALTDLRETVPY